MKRRILFLMALIFLSACTLRGSNDFIISGKVAREKKPLPNVNIYAYMAVSQLDFKKPDYKTKSDEKGMFRLKVREEGDYYITAEVLKEGTDDVDLYAFYGRNPLYVTKSGVDEINLSVQKINGAAKFTKGEKSGIRCILTRNGKPVQGAVVYLALDLNEGMQTKGFTQSNFSDEKGECFISVDEGTYYLTARMRMSGMFGPMKEGDLIGFFHDNPITVKEKGIYTISIELISIPERKDTKKVSGAEITISGTVTGENGEPVEGIWIGAYNDPQMFGKPVYLSKKSDATGRYTIMIPKAGKYYLAARNTLGGPPNPGELYGSYSGTDDHSITVEAGGKITGVNITVLEMW